MNIKIVNQFLKEQRLFSFKQNNYVNGIQMSVIAAMVKPEISKYEEPARLCHNKRNEGILEKRY